MNEALINNILEIIKKERIEYTDFLPQIAIEAGKELVESFNGMNDMEKKDIVVRVKEEMPLEYPYVSVWWYSVLVNGTKSVDLFVEMVRYVRTNIRYFSVNTLYFLFQQFGSLKFRFPELNNRGILEELWVFYFELVDLFKEKITVSLEEIPQEQRDKDLCVVLTEQFLAVQHGPTKTALDRCKILIENMNKKVLLINTAEALGTTGSIPFYETLVGSYNEDLTEATEQHWKNTVIPYFQCENCMPDIEVVNMLLMEIRNMAPGMVVSIAGSGGGMVANLVNTFIPVLSVGLGPADLDFTTCKYQTVGRKLNDNDLEILKKVGLDKENVIESIFTSSLKPQSQHITRQSIGISESDYVVVVVGARLDSEVTDEFLDILENVWENNMLLAFAGTFAEYENRVSKHPKLRTKHLGFCSDILSVMEICDLYVNPLRSGGGTSCVEALYKGVPVVSVNYGDVSVNVGEDFCVVDYDEMKEKIRKYYSDEAFYREMQDKAKERVKILLDTEGEFTRIINEYLERQSN